MIHFSLGNVIIFSISPFNSKLLGEYQQFNKMRQRIEFLVLFGLFYVVILVSSRVVPNKPTLLEGDNGGDLSRVLGLHQGDHNIDVADELLQPDQVKKNQMVLRRKRWAVPADIQDTQCAEGKIRREDGECIFMGKGEDEYDTAPV